jgi:hypothetical protein
MKRTSLISLLAALVLGLLLLHTAIGVRPVEAQNPDLCYAVADHTGSTHNDALVTLNRITGVTTLIGLTGTQGIEAIAFELGAQTLYAADEDQLGTLDLTTGTFTALSQPFGTASGSAGNISLNDVDGLTLDATTGILYGTHRRPGAPKDMLFQINKATGAFVPGAFGAGVDYVLIDGPGVLNDVDDIAVNPVTGQMYAASNNGGAGGVLVAVNKSTGAGTVVGNFGVDDIEGLAYFNDGQLYGSTGAYTTGPDTANKLWRIDETTAAATLVAPFSQFTDYEALDCLSDPTAISLTAFTVSESRGLATWLVVFAAVMAISFSVLVFWRAAVAHTARPER